MGYCERRQFGALAALARLRGRAVIKVSLPTQRSRERAKMSGATNPFTNLTSGHSR
jgi:hypothetical protein